MRSFAFVCGAAVFNGCVSPSNMYKLKLHHIFVEARTLFNLIIFICMHVAMRSRQANDIVHKTNKHKRGLTLSLLQVTYRTPEMRFERLFVDV